MSRKKDSSDGTKRTSFLGRSYKRLGFWVRWPLIFIVVLKRRITGEAKRLAQYNIKWDSIENMPIYNWIKILETGELKWLFIDKGLETDSAAEHWLGLQQQYIDEFGLDESYKQQLRLMEKLKNLNLDFVLTRDRSLLNSIKITEIDLEIDSSKKIISFYDILDHVEKYKGLHIDPKKTSVMKWYYSLKNMSNGKENTGE